MNIKAHSAEKIGPLNLGAGPNDFIYKIFGTYKDQLPTRTVHVTVSVAKAEYEGTVKALMEGLPAEVSVNPTAVYAIQRVEAGIPGESEAEAIARVRAKSVRTQ